MNIGISLYSTREVTFLLTKNFLELIRNDRSNKYIIFTSECDKLAPLFSGCTNVSLVDYFDGNKFRKFIYYYILRPSENIIFNKKKLVGDQKYFLKQYKYSNFLEYHLGSLFSFFLNFELISAFIRKVTYKTDYFGKFELDRCLLTEYFSYKEQCISYNCASVDQFFFIDSHDCLTICGEIKNSLIKILAWHLDSEIIAKKVHGIDSDLISMVGNPSHESIRKRTDKRSQASQEILIFGSNNFIYNEIQMVDEICKNTYLKNLGIKLRIAPSVGGTGNEWKHRYESYKEILGEENLYKPSNEWFGGTISDHKFNNQYYDNITNHSIFIISGVSNVTYDVLARGGIVIQMFYDKYQDKKQFPWWSCEQREVHDHLKEYSGIFICRNAIDIENTLKNNFPNNEFFSDTPYKKTINSSLLIHKEITS